MDILRSNLTPDMLTKVRGIEDRVFTPMGGSCLFTILFGRWYNASAIDVTVMEMFWIDVEDEGVIMYEDLEYLTQGLN